MIKISSCILKWLIAYGLCPRGGGLAPPLKDKYTGASKILNRQKVGFKMGPFPLLLPVLSAWMPHPCGDSRQQTFSWSCQCRDSNPRPWQWEMFPFHLWPLWRVKVQSGNWTDTLVTELGQVASPYWGMKPLYNLRHSNLNHDIFLELLEFQSRLK